jgi:hypothetical protein
VVFGTTLDGLATRNTGREWDVTHLGGGQHPAHGDATLPFPFWRVSLRRRRSPRSGERKQWVPVVDAATLVDA